MKAQLRLLFGTCLALAIGLIPTLAHAGEGDDDSPATSVASCAQTTYQPVQYRYEVHDHVQGGRTRTTIQVRTFSNYGYQLGQGGYRIRTYQSRPFIQHDYQDHSSYRGDYGSRGYSDEGSGRAYGHKWSSEDSSSYGYRGEVQDRESGEYRNRQDDRSYGRSEDSRYRVTEDNQEENNRFRGSRHRRDTDVEVGAVGGVYGTGDQVEYRDDQGRSDYSAPAYDYNRSRSTSQVELGDTGIPAISHADYSAPAERYQENVVTRVRTYYRSPRVSWVRHRHHWVKAHRRIVRCHYVVVVRCGCHHHVASRSHAYHRYHHVYRASSLRCHHYVSSHYHHVHHYRHCSHYGSGSHHHHYYSASHGWHHHHYRLGGSCVRITVSRNDCG